MKIYLASRYVRREEMQEWARVLQLLGHEITSRWIQGGHQIPQGLGHGHNVPFARRFAEEDRVDLMNCDMLIARTEKEGEAYNGRGGRHVELGLALALGKQIVVVGYRENVFCYLREVDYVTTWHELLVSIFGVPWEKVKSFDPQGGLAAPDMA